MSKAALFLGLLVTLFAVFELTVVVLQRAGRLSAEGWPKQLFNWVGVIGAAVMAALLFVRASLG